MAGIFTVAKKEMMDIFSEKKFLLIFGTLLIVVLVSTFQGALSYSNSQSATGNITIGGPGSNNTGPRQVFFGGAENLSNALSSMVTNFSLVGGVLAIAISYDTVNGERVSGSMKTLLSYPIYRDKVIYGKYLGGLAVIAAVTSVTFLAGMGIFIGFSGLTMSADTVTRLTVFFLVSLVYMAIFLAIGLLLSIAMPQPSTSLLASMIVWLASIQLIPNLGYAIAQVISPVRMVFRDGGPSFTTGAGFNTVRSIITALSPSSAYEQIVNGMLTTNTMQFSSGQVSIVSVGLGQSLTTNTPLFIYLAGLMIAVFAAAYVLFMRQEIR